MLKTLKDSVTEAKTFHRVVCNLKPKGMRLDNLQGKEYLVVPMVMLLEGVHNGNEGPYLYPAAELKKRVALWNSKPVVVYHPSEPSACSPLVLNTRGIGTIMNTAWSKGKLTAEAWLDKDRVELVDNRILDAIENEEVLEVSTGLFAESDETPGKWKKEEFSGTLSNFGPDHLAVLPDQVGACSIEDGAGLYRNQANEKIHVPPSWLKQFENEQSANDLRAALNVAIFIDGEYNWVEDVYGTYFIYSTESGSRLFRRDYKVDGDDVRLEGLPEEVERKITYPVVSNADKNKQTNVQGTKGYIMDRNKTIDGLIANAATKWVEDDREFLNGLKDEQLGKLVPVENKEVEVKPEVSAAPKIKNEVADPSKVADGKETPKAELQTDEEYLNSMPTNFRKRWETLVCNEEKEKDRLVAIITANKKSTFAPEWLKEQDVEMLQNLANMAETETPSSEDDVPAVLRPRFNYEGQGDPVTNDDTSNVPSLGLPVTFNKESSAKTA